MAKEYIEREAAIAFLENMSASRYIIQCFGSRERFPAADVVEVRHGEWVPEYPTGAFMVRCSLCKTLSSSYLNRNYCPNCGAKMDGEVVVDA